MAVLQLDLAFTFLGLVCLSVTSFIIFYIILVHRTRQRYAHIPHPKPTNFFLGHIPLIMEGYKNGSYFVEILRDCIEKHGHTIVVFLMHRPVIVTVDPYSIRELMVTGGHSKDPESYKIASFLFGERFLGNGLATNTDFVNWSHRRSTITPAFHRKMLKKHIKDFNDGADTLMKKLSIYSNSKQPINMLNEYNRIALDIIGKVAFGMDIDCIHNDTSPFPRAIHKVMDGFSELTKSPFVSMNPLMRSFHNEVRAAVRFLRLTGKQCFEARLERLSNEESMPVDLLTLAIKAAETEVGVDMEALIDDFVTFFVAGQETTANTLAFTTLELGRNPEVLERLRDEVDAVLGDKDDITFEDVGRLEYMNMVLRESLRLYPPSPMTFRRTCKGTNIGGYAVPFDTTVLLSTYISSRLEEFYPNYAEFDPERFNPNNVQRPNIYVTYPFAIGPRSCIGQQFAMLEAKIILTKFIRSFEFKLDNQNVEPVQIATLRPKGGVSCYLKKRTLND